MQYGSVHFDAINEVVRYEGCLIHLTKMEMATLKTLLADNGHGLTAEEVARAIYAGRAYKQHCIETYIYNIRKKLLSLPNCSLRILTEKAVYRACSTT